MLKFKPKNIFNIKQWIICYNLNRWYNKNEIGKLIKDMYYNLLVYGEYKVELNKEKQNEI